MTNPTGDALKASAAQVPVGWLYQFKDEKPIFMSEKRDWAEGHAFWKETALFAASLSPVEQAPQPPASETHVVGEIAAERRRQIEVKGWTSMHDDKWIDHQLMYAAMAYMLGNTVFWPWDRKWWKPTCRQRNLVKAAALIIAEIERLDRAEERNNG